MILAIHNPQALDRAIDRHAGLEVRKRFRFRDRLDACLFVEAEAQISNALLQNVGIFRAPNSAIRIVPAVARGVQRGAR